ncbi:phosphatase PAP2 family protein [Endozoicomonas arenosclerae]|uniref:phosphatase PAP2 family protein n=1 Tax=Endozoicomonas arenosclerae TaxID=1633495 RepID=UPI0007821E2D|nr:phosphatase PAP2 family protein [Endozoicomonas arenosclerae]
MEAFQFIALLQQKLVAFDSYLRAISAFGYSYHFLLIAGLLYWSGYKYLGARLAIGTEISTTVFGACRQFFASPRPYWLYPELYNGMSEKAFGMPSGHTQNAVVLWGLLASTLKSRWLWALALFMIFSTAISRLYLGVHFPSHILVGISFGTIILFLFISLEKPFLTYLNAKTFWKRCLIVLVACSLPLMITLLFREIFNWGAGNGALFPYSKMAKFTGLFCGIGLGLLFAPAFGKPSLRLFFTQALPGAFSVSLLYKLLPYLPQPEDLPTLYYLFRWLEAFLVAFWGAGLWPMTYQRLLGKHR